MKSPDSVIPSNGRAAKLRTEGSGVTLDTIGAVGPYALDAVTPGFIGPNGIRGLFLTWDELDPFTQGYIEALLTGPVMATTDQLVARGRERDFARFVFSDLARETLARIIADCGLALADKDCGYTNTAGHGHLFWKERQADQLNGVEPRFPPLTVTLGDDGKVRFGSAPTPLGEELGATGGEGNGPAGADSKWREAAPTAAPSFDGKGGA